MAPQIRPIVFAACVAFMSVAQAADPPRTWKHDGGTFQQVDDKKWVEKAGRDTFELSVKASSDERVTLIDQKRKLHITLTAGKAVVLDLDNKAKPKQLKGDWVAAADAKKPVEKGLPGAAADRVAWKYGKGVFERTAKDRWVQTTSDGKKTEYVEKAKTDEYVELYDAAGKRSVRLMEKLAVEKGELNREYRPILGKGEWVANTGPAVDPKATKPAAAKFTEVATMRMDDAPEPDAARTVPGFSPDGKLVARRIGKLWEEQFAVLELATGKEVHVWPKGEYVLTSAWSADGKTLAGLTRFELNKTPAQIVVWEVGTWKEKARFDLRNQPEVLAISGDGKYVATVVKELRREKYARVFDVGQKKLAFEVQTHIDSHPGTLALSTDGKTLAASRCGKDGDQIGLFDLTSRKPRGSFKGGDNFALSADGGLLVEWASSHETGSTITVHDTKGGAKAEPRTIKDDKWVARSVAFLDGATHLAVGTAQAGKESRGGGVRVYSLKTLEPVELFTFGKPEKEEPGPRVWATPNSAFLLTQTNDHTLRLFATPFGPRGKP